MDSSHSSSASEPPAFRKPRPPRTKKRVRTSGFLTDVEPRSAEGNLDATPQCLLQERVDKDQTSLARKRNHTRRTFSDVPASRECQTVRETALGINGTSWTEHVRKASHARVAETVAYRQYEAEQERSEREWYEGDDSSTPFYASNMYASVPEPLVATAESQVRKTGRFAGAEDNEKWETSQMRAGMNFQRSAENCARGAGVPDRASLDEDAGPRIVLVVKQEAPPFLKNDYSSFSKIAGARTVLSSDVVMPVKDCTSDMAVVARKGSPSITVYREYKSRGGARARYWELGTATGAKGKEDAAREAECSSAMPTEPEVSADTWRQSASFANVLQRNSSRGNDDKEEKEGVGLSELGGRDRLPIALVRQDLMRCVRENQVVVVVGETGSGKTTQLTQYLHADGYASYGVIGCTQPRRVAAVSIAQRVCEEFGRGVIGEEVGYAIRFEDMTSPRTRIKYMTDGILLRESLSDQDLEAYSVLVMDEAHERSLNTDVLFGALKGVISRRRDLKVIVTSATLNADRFSEFFGKVPIFRIPGRTFPVDVFFFKSIVEDYVDAAVFQTMQVHLQAPLPGDILVFMTGQEDIEATSHFLAEKMKKLERTPPVVILPIYSQLAADMQARVFAPAQKGVRKVIIATNIAETSLTIGGIKYVIDSGFCKLKTYNPRLGIDALLVCPASQAAVNQRAGRAGRTGPGKCYRLFTEAAYRNELLEGNIPEIQRTNLSHVVLLLKSLGVRDLLDFPFLDPPPADNVLQSMHSLWHLGALDSDGELSELGRRMSQFPLDPGLSSLIFSGERLDCLEEALTIIAMLSVPNVFLRLQGREEESDSAREKFFVPESDHLTLLHTFNRWLGAGRAVDWCSRHFLNAKGLRKAMEVKGQLSDICKNAGMEISSTDDWDQVRQAVASAFYFQAARRHGMSDYINVRTGVVCGLHPTSSIFGNGLTPDYVVYHELIFTRKEFMSCVTAVEPQWLVDAPCGSRLYSIRMTRNRGGNPSLGPLR